MHIQQSFFKDLDSILAKIIKEENHENKLLTILGYMEIEFNHKFQIEGNCLYEKRAYEFVKNYSSGSITWNRYIPYDGTVLRRKREHGSFIYSEQYL